MIKHLITSLHQNRFKTILDKYDTYTFISPHLDDAVLSCANLILRLIKNKKRIKIITVFTKSLKIDVTPQAKEFVSICGYNDSLKLFKDRASEDVEACRYIGAKYKHLGFVDAAWRTNNKEPVYPDPKTQFSGVVSKKDISLIKNIKNKILKNIPGRKIILFAPIGIGEHADHLIVSRAVSELPYPKIFWEDFPYNLNKTKKKNFFNTNNDYKIYFKTKTSNNNLPNELIRKYKSQISSLFPNSIIPKVTENYYLQNNSK